MPTIKIEVQGKIAKNLTPNEKIVCGNEDYKVEFQFDSSWDGASIKTALFVFNQNLVAVPFDGNVCDVPIIKNTTLLAIGVKSSDGALFTTTPAYADCLKSVSDLATNKIPAPTQDVYDEIIALINNIDTGGMTKDELETLISDTLINANNYTDEKVDQAVTDINTNTIKPLQEQVVVHDRSIALLQDDIERVDGIAKGAQEGVGYNTYMDMVTTLNGADKNLIGKFKNIIIGTEDVPDLYVFDYADEPNYYNYTSEQNFANDLITNKSVRVGYFILKRLETGKVPLENYYTKDETDNKLEEAIDTASVFVERWF